jgi:hypothetical protein
LTVVTRVPVEELDVVELLHPLEGFDTGTRGAVVSAWPEADDYTVEVVDESGKTLGLLSAHLADIRRANDRYGHDTRVKAHDVVIVYSKRVVDKFHGKDKFVRDKFHGISKDESFRVFLSKFRSSRSRRRA